MEKQWEEYMEKRSVAKDEIERRRDRLAEELAAVNAELAEHEAMLVKMDSAEKSGEPFPDWVA